MNWEDSMQWTHSQAARVWNSFELVAKLKLGGGVVARYPALIQAFTFVWEM